MRFLLDAISEVDMYSKLEQVSGTYSLNSKTECSAATAYIYPRGSERITKKKGQYSIR